MDIFFEDPTEIPLPPDEVRIRELRAEPWPDGLRVKIYLEVDPFQQKPSANVFIHDAQGRELAQASVIETMTRRMEFTMHLRQAEPGGEYRLNAVLFYTDPLPEPQPGEQAPIQLPDSTEVDRAEVTFTIAGKEDS